jgi:hypothetical protein
MRRHELDPFSLVFGLLFATLGSIFLAGRVDATELHLEWIWPIPLIVLGALIIVMASRHPGRGAAPQPWPSPSGTDPAPLTETDRPGATVAEVEPVEDED